MATIFQSFRHSMETRKPYRGRKRTLAGPLEFFLFICKLMKLSTLSQDYKQRPVTHKSLYFVKIPLIQPVFYLILLVGKNISYSLVLLRPVRKQSIKYTFEVTYRDLQICLQSSMATFNWRCNTNSKVQVLIYPILHKLFFPLQPS